MDTEPQGMADLVTTDATGPGRSVPFLSDPRRVAVLAEVADAEGPISTVALARRVAATETGKRECDVSPREARIVHASLRQTHLPKLSTRSLIEWDAEAETVSLSSNVSTPRLRRFLEGRSSMASSRILRTLSHPRRRSILRLLDRHGSPITVPDLARLSAAEERAVDPEAVSETEVDRIRVSLVHSHLPALSAAEFIEYDEDAGLVTETAGGT